MAHVTQDTSWCTIDIDTQAGKIVLQERWQYVWLLHSPRMTRWTLAEKRAFHARAEREIWNAWSNRAFLRVEGSSDFAKRFRGREVPVFVDVRWVVGKPHWTVHVTKVSKDQFVKSQVLWTARKLSLDSNDFSARETCFGPPKSACVTQMPIAHEFGHTMGNIGKVHGNPSDEYSDGSGGRKVSPYWPDIHSLMHRGSQLRERHFEHLMTELYGLIPDTSFAVARLQ